MYGELTWRRAGVDSGRMMTTNDLQAFFGNGWNRHDVDVPWGIFGGHDGINAYVKVTEPDGTVEQWPSKFTGLTLKAGSTIEIAVPNSGGYGDPVERDPQLVRSDVLDGFTTVERGERDYAVVIDPDTLEVDVEATARTREGRSAAIPA